MRDGVRCVLRTFATRGAVEPFTPDENKRTEFDINCINTIGLRYLRIHFKRKSYNKQYNKLWAIL